MPSPATENSGGPIILVGASSRAADAMRNALAPHDIRGVGRGGPRADHCVANYTDVPAGLPFASAVVINCVGTAEGTPQELNALNCEVPLAWANAARRGGARHFIQLSSFSVYAPTSIIHADSAIGPTNAYGQSKLTAERGLATLATPEFAVSLLRVPILVANGADGANDKLAALVKLIRQTRMLPRPRRSPKRSMLTYGGLGAAVAKLVFRPTTGVVAAADSEPFSYDLVQQCAASMQMHLLEVRVPRSVQWLVRKAIPSIGDRLFHSLELASDFNFLRGENDYPRLSEAIAAHLSR